MTLALDYAHAEKFLGDAPQVDTSCPSCGPGRSNPHSQMAKKLRLWRIGDGAIGYKCVRCSLSGFVTVERSRPVTEHERAEMRRNSEESRKSVEGERERKRRQARTIWAESVEPIGTWAEGYLRQRGLVLPADDYIRRRTLRFHPQCPFQGIYVPALICAFAPILTSSPVDPFEESPIAAIHRIRGRGHANKAMLGSIAMAAIQFGEWEQVSAGGVLNVAEGAETAIKLYDNHRPIWALGSAVQMANFPVLGYVKRLVIWADNDASGTGLDAAKQLATKYRQAGKSAVIWMRPQEGDDYGEA